MQKWEYLVVETYVDRNRVVKAINGVLEPPKDRINFYEYLQTLGDQGWELVGGNDILCYFKRPKTV
jgi:hypothetical protein